MKNNIRLNFAQKPSGDNENIWEPKYFAMRLNDQVNCTACNTKHECNSIVEQINVLSCKFQIIAQQKQIVEGDDVELMCATLRSFASAVYWSDLIGLDEPGGILRL